jgi:trans-aconitate 2-methyltransferase
LNGTAPRSASPSWDAALYGRYAGERMRPALDLLKRLPADIRPTRIIDLGCGTGEITKALKEHWPDAEVIGLDNAAPMLDKARDLRSEIAWVDADIAAWNPERPFDLVFSNAALHWLDGHEVLFARLMQAISEGGLLAAQMPRNFEAASHRLMRETAEEEPWRYRLRPLLRAEPVMPPARYYDLLAPLATDLDIWETEYLHILEGDTPVLDWVRGSGLRPILDALTDSDERARFIARYQEKLAKAYPRRDDGRTLFPFRRLFLIARRR